ncbi:MAG: glycosyltransferase [Thermoflexales bacterium]|nr:glycosyltransferase [Thermoflexales bacterium]
MRLLIVGPKWVGEWTESMERASRALGHTPLPFYYDTYGVVRLQGGAVGRLPKAVRGPLTPFAMKIGRAWEARMNQRLIETARSARPDAIIILKGETLTGDTLMALKTLKCPLVSWWVDDPFRAPQAIRLFQLFDVLYMFDKGRLSELEAAGAQHIVYLPCACDHQTFQPQTLNPADYPNLNCTIGFVAAFYPGRGALLGEMQGFDVGLWGPGWDAAPELQQLPATTWRGRRINATDAAKVYNLAKICPNVHHPQTQLGGLNTRTFEVLATGGFELVDNVAGLEENFEVGREIVTYTSPAQWRELADYYLAHPDERAAISARGRARVLHNHTYEERLKTILRTLPV